MDFSKKEDRKKYLEEKFDNLLDVIGETYGSVLMEELVSRLDTTIEDFHKEMSKMFEDLKTIESDRQNLLKDIRKNKSDRDTTENIKKKTSDKNLSEWEKKLEAIEKN